MFANDITYITPFIIESKRKQIKTRNLRFEKIDG